MREDVNNYVDRDFLNFQAVIKSAASAASPIAWGEPRSRRPPAEAVVLALPKQHPQPRGAGGHWAAAQAFNKT